MSVGSILCFFLAEESMGKIIKSASPSCAEHMIDHRALWFLGVLLIGAFVVIGVMLALSG